VAFHYLAIEGPIGVGKTRLAERLATKLEATTILEDTENPFLSDFYADRPGAALQAQLFYLLNRHRQLTSKRQADLFLQTTICDYVFDKDKIFAYLNLDDNELFIYQRLFDLLGPRRAAAGSRRLPAGADGIADGAAAQARQRSGERNVPLPRRSTSASSTRRISISSSTTPRRRCWSSRTSEFDPSRTTPRSMSSSSRSRAWGKGTRYYVARQVIS
jgi:hypothetical protein